MVLRCLRAELMKCRRAPVWLAFLVLPLFPAVLGTFNYLGNLEVLDAGWYSLWTQHTLFASMFFLPAQFGVFCAWQWRLEHADHNWNAALTAPVPVRALYLGKLLLDVGVSALAMALIGLLFLLSGRLAGISAPLPPELRELIERTREISRHYEGCQVNICLNYGGRDEILRAARDFARDHRCVLVLKGHRTVTAAPDGRAWINTTGNPGMSKGGSGDVLAGLILALLGQGWEPELAARDGVYLHGEAGDRCAGSLGEYGMTPGDLVERLPETLEAHVRSGS